VEASEYDKKNHVKSPAIQKYYERLFNQYVFNGRSSAEVRQMAGLRRGLRDGFSGGLLTRRK